MDKQGCDFAVFLEPSQNCNVMVVLAFDDIQYVTVALKDLCK